MPPDIERLDDLERRAIVEALLWVLTRQGCAADPSFTTALAKVCGVDTVIYAERS